MGVAIDHATMIYEAVTEAVPAACPIPTIPYKVTNELTAYHWLILNAAETRAIELGYSVIVVPVMDGEFAIKAQKFVTMIKNLTCIKRKICVLSAGRQTIHLRGNKKNRLNHDFALAALLALGLKKNITILIAGSPVASSHNGGCCTVIDEHSVTTAMTKRLNPHKFLRENNAFGFFERIGANILAGKTQTNHTDIIIGLSIPS